MRSCPLLPRLLLPFVAASGWAAPASASDESANLRFFRDLAETRNYTLGRPVKPQLTPDGAHVIFLRSEPRDPTLRLFEFTVATGAERELLSPTQLLGAGPEQLSPEEKARRERQRQSLKGFTSYALSKDGQRLLTVLSGRLYVIERDTLAVHALPGEGWIDPRFSPDGRFVAAVRDRELHVISLASPAPTSRQLTTGAGGALTHATAEFVAQEEMNRFQGYWWSPDSTRLVYQENDESEVATRYVADALHPDQLPVAFAYPHAGSANARVRLGVISRDGGATRWLAWDAVNFPYVAAVSWENPRAPLTLLVQNRRQTAQTLLAVDPATGATTVLLHEEDAAWLNLDANVFRSGAADPLTPPVWLEDGHAFLWSTEARGTWQLELRDATGRLLRELTPPDFGYRGLLGVAEAAGQIYVRGGADLREAQVWRFPLAGGPGVALTHERGQHSATPARTGDRLVHTFDQFDGRSGTRVIDADGRVLGTLRSVAETPPLLPTTELTRTRGEPALDAALTRPRAFDPARRYPVILQVYAGPGVKRVNAVIRDFLPDQWLADQGYLVVRIDGRGTPFRSRAWERVIKGNFIDVALADQIAGLQDLAAHHPGFDLSRVGVTGWSFGGYFSAMATLRRPDIFRAGVAGAPVITWENYDTHYTERYLGLPQEAPKAYRVSNVTTYAGELRRPLLLIHGLTDDNVYFQHTLQLADALFVAGKPYELLPMLGTHMVSDPVIQLRQQQRIVEFFDRTVKPAE